MQQRPNVHNARHFRISVRDYCVRDCNYANAALALARAPPTSFVDLQIYPILFRPSSHFPDLIPGLCIECKEERERDTARFLRGGLSGADTKNGAITMDLAEPVSILIKVIEVSSSFGLVGSPPLWYR